MRVFLHNIILTCIDLCISYVMSHSDILVPERLLVVSEWYEDCAEKHIESKQLSK